MRVMRVMRVMKFGGTSVATAERLETVARLVAESAAETRVVVVASALRGVTDRLVELVATAADRGVPEPVAWASEEVERLRRRHRALLDRVATGRRRRRAAADLETRLHGLARRLRGAALLGTCPDPVRDEILAAGERLSVSVVAAALQERGLYAPPIDGGRWIATDSRFGRARVDAAATRERSAETLASLPHRAVPVVTGFVAADSRGRTTTLGRGGSDYSASLLAAALDADRVEVWTDVDAVFTADPHRHPDAVPIAVLSHDDAAEIAWHGGRVLHRRSLEPLAGRDVELIVRNTLRPEAAGTRVVPGIPPASGGGNLATTAVTARCGLLLLRLAAPLGRTFRQAESVLRDSDAEICHRLQTRPDRMLLLVDAVDPEPLVRRLESTGLSVMARPDVAMVAVVGGPAAAWMLQAVERCGSTPLAVLSGDRLGSCFVLVDGANAETAVAAMHSASKAHRAASEPYSSRSATRSSETRAPTTLRSSAWTPGGPARTLPLRR